MYLSKSDYFTTFHCKLTELIVQVGYKTINSIDLVKNFQIIA